jgi:hypothetical protein
LFAQFVNQESGAVTVDWVVLTAAVVGLGASAAAAVRVGTNALGGTVGSSLESTQVMSMRWLNARDVIRQSFADGNFAGWSQTRTMAFGAWGTALGPFGNDTQNNPLTVGISLGAGATNAMVEFDLIVADTWDGVAGPNNAHTRPEGDVIRFQINGQTIATEPFVQRENHSGFRPGMFSERATTVVLDGATYNLRMAPAALPTTNVGGATGNDQRWRVQLEAVNAPQNFQLGYSAITSNGTGNESFGITNFSVREN